MFSSLFSTEEDGNATSENSPKSDDVWESLMSTAMSVGKVVSETVKVGAEKAANVALGDFQNLQKDFISSQQNDSGSSLPPWVGCDNEEELKVQILALSKDKRNFVRDPPVGQNAFVFNFQRSAASAMATLQEDVNLEKMRLQLVPKVMLEERFWQNYFYRVSLIKQSSEVSAMASEPLVSGSGSKQDDKGDEAEQPTLPTRPPADDIDSNALNDMHDSSLLDDMEDEEELSTLETPNTQQAVSLADLDKLESNNDAANPTSTEDSRDQKPQEETTETTTTTTTTSDNHDTTTVSASSLADLERSNRESQGLRTPDDVSPPVVGDVTPSDDTTDTLASANWEKDLEAELEGFSDCEESQDTEDLGAGWEDEVAQMLKDEEEQK